MDKKSPYKAYYFATVPEVTQAQIKANNELPQVDISAVEQRMDKNSIYGMVVDDETTGYPWRCKTVPSAPAVLFAQWDADLLNRLTIAIVWPRNLSSYAEQVIHMLFEELAQYDLITVSGLANGVDMLSHNLSIRHKIPTVAVLGWWFAYYLKSRRREMMQQIVREGGMILSEYKHQFVPTDWSFPQRNRLIAGLADLIFLPEAQRGSGSLITAEMWNKLNKPVYAPMQSIFADSSAGSNEQIAAGKRLPLDRLDQFLAQYFSRRNGVERQSWAMEQLTTEEQQLLACIDHHGEANISQFVAYTRWTVTDIFTTVSLLEINWLIMEKTPGVYVRKKRTA